MLATHTNTAAVTAGPATLQPGLPSRRRPTASWWKRRLTKVGAPGVALAVLVQVTGLCLCITRAQASTDPHACCPRPASKPSGCSTPASTSLVTDHARDCCPTSVHARTDVRISEREPLSAPASNTVSSNVSFTTLADQATPFDGTAATSPRASSPPRSPVLRI
jgi:hypothetical protein